MRLVQDKSVGGYAVTVLCASENCSKPKRRFTLAEGYADLDGIAFEDYYHDEGCALQEYARRAEEKLKDFNYRGSPLHY